MNLLLSTHGMGFAIMLTGALALWKTCFPTDASLLVTVLLHTLSSENQR